ncbi:hypothetical protein BYT27DRAFT_7232045 [Phlegmacium glaucopus]|nr:hypothetical protein BYT27DRAFT_7232045 [Phlegmacium glaucopus]
MQVASSAYPSSLSHAHYHSPYLSQRSDQELKRKYLALLPPQQIIEICLTFDVHVPPYVKSTVWPSDINAAIAALHRTASPSSNDNAPENVLGKSVSIMDSLQSPLHPPTAKEDAPPTEPQPPDKEPLLAPATPPIQSNTPVISEPAQPAPPAQHPHPHPPQPMFPHQPYGFSPSTAYPHNPYYPAHGTAYAYPHSAYTPYPMQNGYHLHVPPAYPAPSSAYNNLPQPEGVNADDLPSYEEMIVEALSSTTDPEGYAPKDLFTWMASRYPLQSNFRPSASQALQKAYRRGRFEKSSGGKYRLNPTWDGGNTLRRSTRRPQTQNSLSSGPPATASPFTKTPLVHHHHQQTPAPSNAATAARPPFPPYGFPYAHMGYPGVPPQPEPQPTPGASSPSTKQLPDHDSDSINAYEAAQTILKAINFGNLLQLPAEDSDDVLRANDQSQHSGLETLLSHVQAALANSAAEATTAGPLPVTGPAVPTPPAPPTNLEPAVDPRAELQAQLALLAAQLAELSQAEEAASMVQDVPPPVSTFVSTHDPPPQMPPPTPAVPDVNPSEIQDDDDDDDSDDDDMEEII